MRKQDDGIADVLVQIALLPLTLLWAVVKGVAIGLFGLLFFWSI